MDHRTSEPPASSRSSAAAELAAYEALLDRAERLGRERLPFDDLRQLGRLYRVHAAELARLRDRGEDPVGIRHRNALAVRAFTFLYAAPEPRGVRLRRRLETLPSALGRTIAATWRAQAVAWCLLAAGAVLGVVLTARDPEALFALMPGGFGYGDAMLEDLQRSPEARAQFLAREETPAAHDAFFGSYLFSHNTRVGLLSFASGVLAGIPPVLLQLYNGLVIGGFGHVFLRDPNPLPFLAWILPHGIPEFTAITLCAAGGLLLGAAVARPGRSGRAAALRRAGDPAVVLFLGALPLFAWAAFVESFVRESAIGSGPRLALAGAEAALLIVALSGVRRLARAHASRADWLRELAIDRSSATPAPCDDTPLSAPAARGIGSASRP